MKPLNHQAKNLKQSGIRATTVRCTELNGVNLGQGVCDIPILAEIKKTACEAINNNDNLYSDYRGTKPLRQAVAKKIADFNYIEVNSETQVMITHGATGAYVTAMKTLINSGDEIILFEPFYGYHREVAEMFDVTVKAVRINRDDYSIDMKTLENTITPRTKAIVICTPNNPTGKVYSKEELLAIGRLAKKHDLYIITDEMYEYFTYPGFEHVSIASLENFFERTITISGFSKVYNMTGWRLGYAYGPAELINRMTILHDFFYVCPVTPLQEAVVTALQLPSSYYEELQSSYLAKRNFTVKGLRDLGFTLVEPQGAYYILANGSETKFNVPERSLGNVMLEDYKVAAVPGSAFYLDVSAGKDELRFCYAHEEARLVKAMAQLC